MAPAPAARPPACAPPNAFDALALGLDDRPASPLPRVVLRVLLALLAAAGMAVALGRVDVVAVAEGRLVPRTLLKVVQPAEAGVVREILVEEGEHVVAGQPLVRLDPRLADADVRLLKHELVARSLQLRRIDAEAADAPLARRPGDAAEAFDEAAALHAANRAAHADQLAQGRAAVERLARELAAAQEVERKLERTVPMVKSVAARFGRLRDEGFVSELAALEREREHVEREQDLAAQGHTVRALQASFAQAQRQVDATRSAYRRALAAERADAMAQLVRAREALDKQLLRRDSVELSAPEAGVVKELATRTTGSVVAAGTVLVTLVPAGDPIEAEVLVRNEDAGFVRPGQRAEVKVAAFPFQKYGMVAGEVLRIGPDASAPGSASEDARAGPGGYRSRLALAAASLPFEGTRLAFAPGMAVHAEIHLGRRPLVDYLLGPVQKAWHEAARER
ncbi:MAG TPA: HlyD family type I secretion periplasmic adaptor subunit [Casimicrobiaceae bacterium]|nr:HlyD family type I secretion periplasmic adaptor subunit [Casimicrobiaceae bacterium]